MPSNAAIKPVPRAPASLHDLMGVVAVELADLRTAVDSLQELIGELAGLAGPALSADAIMRLQHVDSVSQRLARLAHLAQVLQLAAHDAARPLSPSADLLDALLRLQGARGQPARI
jgi:hypothetical protein